MGDFVKNKITTILVATATILLASVAIITAIKLFNLRSQSITPTSPESNPIAQTSTAPTSSPTSTQTPTPSSIPIAQISPTQDPISTPTLTSTPTSSPQPNDELPAAGSSKASFLIVTSGALLLLSSLSLAW